jgi:outer membrane protein assembly factor BamB
MLFRRGLALALALVTAGSATANDWPRFRGPAGSGVSEDSGSIPINWSDSENLAWKTQLPGPGLSSPIVVGDRVYVTSWTGFEAGEGSSDKPEDLKRALVCIDRNTGNIVWTKSVDSVLPEDEFRGMFAENGYASHTPACDGENIYCFFGKTGVVAFDLDGNQLWHTSVGTGRDPRGWGSASSPVLYENLVIVTASAESESLVALDKATGQQVWKEEAPTLAGTWSTPVIVDVDQERTDLVISVPSELWGLNPKTGKLRWYCVQPGGESDSVTASVVVSEGPEPVAYVLGGRDNGSMAVKVGGKGDVTQSNMVWQGDDRASIGTPVLHEKRLYWISRGIANCIDAETGEEIYKERLSGGSGGGGGIRGGDYSSPIIADGKLYFMTRGGTGYVLKLGDEFEQLAANRFDSETGEYSATPAVSDGQLFIRSTSTLYCVSND